jgi:hypothetical protein
MFIEGMVRIVEINIKRIIEDSFSEIQKSKYRTKVYKELVASLSIDQSVVSSVLVICYSNPAKSIDDHDCIHTRP